MSGLQALGGGRTDVWTDGCMDIHPCVLQDIGPLGPLPKKALETRLSNLLLSVGSHFGKK